MTGQPRNRHAMAHSHSTAAAFPSRALCCAVKRPRHINRIVAARIPASEQTTVIERRAADVVVIGSSYTAAAASYSLARRGKKVIWLSNFTFPATKYRLEGLKPLHLPSNEESMAMYTAEAAAYWRGMQNLSQQTFFHMCGTVDIGSLRGQTDAGDALGAIHDATKAAGIKSGLLRVDEAATLFPQIIVPNGFGCLQQREGGVLDCGAAFGAIADLANRQGVLLRGNLLLRGWKDCDGFFSIRASSELLPSSESVFETEHILLAPEVGDWGEGWQALFGLSTELEVRQACLSRCPVGESTVAHPVWRWLGSGVSKDTEEERAQEDSLVGCWGVPTPAQNTMRVAQAPGRGQLLGTDTTGPPDRPLVGRLHELCSSIVKGASDPEGRAAKGSYVTHICSQDGYPVLGSHPGFEEGRVLLAATTSGGFLGGCDGYQLSPLLAKAAADSIYGAGDELLSRERCSASRAGVGIGVMPVAHDTWSELDKLLESFNRNRQAHVDKVAAQTAPAEERDNRAQGMEPARKYFM